jgi:ferric-dicitrate binding protein FerR (iron transport regulator)
LSTEAESLLEGWLDGSLSETDEKQLQVWLLAEPEHMRRFVEANARDQLLREVARLEFTAEEVREKAMPLRLANRFYLRSATWAAAIAASIAVTLFLFWPNQPSGVNVEIVFATNLRFSDATVSLKRGDRRTLKHFRLESGSLEMLFPSGVLVEFVAPAEAELESDMRLRLLEGRISADVGQRGKGFTVVTDAGEIIDLGTRFGVEADSSGESRVAVFSGAVEFHPRDSAAAGKFVTLTEGEALRFSARAGLHRWQQVALEADRAGLSGAANFGVVREVRDNLGEGELRPFYGVVHGGLRAGALAFTDKPNPVWRAIPGEEFPSWLEGADLVRTYYHFRNVKDYELTLTLSEPADVFVLVSTGETPGWLRDRFELTGTQLRAGPWHPGIASHPAAVVEPDGTFVHFAVWKCAAGAGELKLGPPRENKSRGVQSLMYGLAVKAKSSP